MAQGAAVTSLVGNVADTLFVKAKEEFGYIWKWSKNVEDLEYENKKLTLMRVRVLELIKAATDKGDRLLPGVKEWVDKAESHITEAQKIIDGAKAKSQVSEAAEVTRGVNADSQEEIDDYEVIDGANADSVEGGTRYSYGKKAANMAPLLKRVQEEGKPFEYLVSVFTPPPGIQSCYKRKNIDDLDTHKLCLESIMESIEDDSKQIIGIWGIGGVGKTTLAKEVAVTCKVKSLFAAVDFVTVSQHVDAVRIKKEVEATAKRIIQGEKILVILDDLWGEVKLDEVGIPKNSKILLTSRSKDVCKRMNAACLINVDTLTTTESWILFKSVVGDTVEKDKKLKEIAEEIVKGCGGLPLILQVVGATLKSESIESWRRALTHLQKRTTSDIDENISLAFSHLQLSYDFLRSEETKIYFLLCSLFPEDYDIPLESLAYYGVGLEIFKDLDSMEDARNGVRRAVKILKSTSLLLAGKDESTVRMHDVVREVALLIASEGSNKFLVKAGIGLKEWEPRPKRVKSCTGISLMMNDIWELPDYKLDIPLLDIFLIQRNILRTIPGQFILGVKEARVLDLEANRIESLPPSMNQLTTLCVLNLGGNRFLSDISVLGELKLLEILILSRTRIAEIPQKIGNLVNLRRLEVTGCEGLSHIAPGVISKLRWLEELHLGYYGDEDGNNEGLMEIGKLSMLTFLDLYVRHVRLIPKGVRFTKLKGFVIQIGGHVPMYEVAEVVHRKTLILGMEDLDTTTMLQVTELIDSSDGLIFDSVANQQNIVPAMYCESLDDLTTIMLSRCYDLLSLADDKEVGGEDTKKQYFSKLEHLFLSNLSILDVLWKSPYRYISCLKNLVTLKISDCGKLVRLFSVNAARKLVNLRTLTIQMCTSLKEVIWDEDEGDIEDEDEDEVVFRCLVKIELIQLHSLESFYAGKVKISCPSLEKVEMYGCGEMDKWDKNGTYDAPNLKLVNQDSLFEFLLRGVAGLKTKSSKLLDLKNLPDSLKRLICFHRDIYHKTKEEPVKKEAETQLSKSKCSLSEAVSGP